MNMSLQVISINTGCPEASAPGKERIAVGLSGGPFNCPLLPKLCSVVEIFHLDSPTI